MADMRERSPRDATPPTQAAQPVQAGTAGPLSLDAFSAVVGQRQVALFAFVQGLVGEAELARDLTQDTFHDAWRATQATMPPWSAAHDDDERRRWLFHTAYCRAISHLRRRKLIRWASLDWWLDWPRAAGMEGADGRALPDYSATTPVSAAPLASFESFEERLAETEALRAALARLRPDDTACLLLRVAQGFSAAETAAMLGTTVDAVGQRLARARKRLRAVYLEQNPPDEDARTSGQPSTAHMRGERSDGDE